MIRQFIALYRARKDLALAKQLASEMIIDGAIDKVSWPLTVAKLWMSVGVAVISALILAFLLIGAATHWTLAIPVLPLGAAIYAIIRLWRGANAGVGYVTHLAKTELRHKASLLKTPGVQPQETPSGSL
ncbi:MAG: hypothetical protein ABJO36_02075 [Litorimonas sp.]